MQKKKKEGKNNGNSMADKVLCFFLYPFSLSVELEWPNAFPQPLDYSLTLYRMRLLAT